MLDLTFVRQQFPAFSEPSLAGQAFFENAGGSYACGQVIRPPARLLHQKPRCNRITLTPASERAGAGDELELPPLRRLSRRRIR